MTGGRDRFLSRVVGRRRADVAAAYGALSRRALEGMAAGGRPVRDFAGALVAGDRVAVIAEVKRASPSAGPIAPDADAAAQAGRYEAGGAAAVSVLTEPSSFDGSFEDLAAVASAVRLPVLCKDFVVDEAQVFVARGCGADAVLLMVSVLGEDVAGWIDTVRSLRMEPLVEVVSERELDIAIRARAATVAVNSRDLHTLEVDPSRALGLVTRANEADLTVVLASGVKAAEDVGAAAAAGADAVLVGETLMRAPDPTVAAAALAGTRRRSR